MKKIIAFLILGSVFMSCAKEENVAVISTKFGDMVVEFYPDVAPMHVESFTIFREEIQTQKMTID